MVPGHEIVGTVLAKGSNVTKFKEGQRVGIGVQVLSCRSCQYCNNKLEQYCLSPSSVYTYNAKYPDGFGAYGGYSKRMRVHQHWTYEIPDNLDSAEVAPLFCAGATVFEPLRRFGVGKGHKVGIVGIGGLGHLAIQFAVAVGAEVTAISHSPSKKELAAKLGAHSFICTPEEKHKAKDTFDYLLSTDNASSDITDILRLLKPLGQLVLVGLAEEKMKFTPNAVVNGRTIHGSTIASPSRIQEMLRVASEHNIKAHVKVFPIDKVNEALAGVRQGKPRFRYVLKIQD